MHRQAVHQHAGVVPVEPLPVEPVRIGPMQVELLQSEEVQPRHDPWLGQDKFLHWAVSALLYGSSYHFYAHRIAVEVDSATLAAAGTTLSIGIGKEIYDLRDGRFFSWRDMAANMAGVLTGYFLFTFEW